MATLPLVQLLIISLQAAKILHCDSLRLRGKRQLLMQPDSVPREQHWRAYHIPAGFNANNPYQEVSWFPTPPFSKARRYVRHWSNKPKITTTIIYIGNGSPGHGPQPPELSAGLDILTENLWSSRRPGTLRAGNKTKKVPPNIYNSSPFW